MTEHERLRDFTRRQQQKTDEQFSVIRALAALANDPLNAKREAPREARISDDIAERVGRAANPGCFFVPINAQRDLSAASPSGGSLVGSQTAPGDVFESALRNASVMTGLGVQTQAVDQSDATFPRGLSDAPPYWLSTESTAITEGQPSFGQIAATPKTVGVYTELSGRLLRQTSAAAEAFILRELAKAVAAAADAAMIDGSGNVGQPLGLLRTPDVATSSGASLTWGAVTSTIGSVEDANAMIDPTASGWAIASDAAAIMRGREKAAGSGFILADGKIDGHPALVSNSVPSGSAIFGDWSGLLLATWGILEIGVNRADSGSVLFRTGAVGIRVLWTVDIAVLRPQSFSALTGIS